MSLLANDSFMKHVNRDPEGYGKDDHGRQLFAFNYACLWIQAKKQKTNKQNKTKRFSFLHLLSL
jgi:hypothetical protein